MIQPFMLNHQIKLGRVRCSTCFLQITFLIRKRKRRIQTTNSYLWLRKYPDHIRNFVPTAPNQLWVSDITYWKISTAEHLYISFITDVYSHKIVGYKGAPTMEAIRLLSKIG